MPSQPPVSLSVTVNQRDIDRITKRLSKWQGRPLEFRMSKALQAGVQLLVAPIRAITPVGKTGNLLRSVGTRKLKKRSGEIPSGAYAVGPVPARGGRHRHLVIRGHRTASGSMTKANPFVDRAVRPLEPMVLRFIDEQIRRLA